MRTIWVLTAAGALAAAAWGADCVVEPAPAADLTADSPAYDATLELKWDSGSSSYQIAYYTGAGAWVGNDFDISTLAGYRAVASMRVYTSTTWPNSQWEGFRLGIFDYTSSVPGSLLWGPKFAMGSRTGWNNFSVGWTLPTGKDAFIAAVEQYYNYPNCDPHVVDNNSNFLRHSWAYYAGRWGYYSNSTPGYYNLMIRVIVNNETLAVEPASLGAVKSLFY